MAGLPVQQLSDAQPQSSMLQMKEVLHETLTAKDAQLIQRYFLRYDCENLALMLEGAIRNGATAEAEPGSAVSTVRLDLGYLKDEVRRELDLPEEKPFDKRGNYSQEDLQQLIEEARSKDGAVKGFPVFMADFIREFDLRAGQHNWFARDAVLLAYYDYARQCPNAMMAEWYDLNFNILNILTALIARKQGWTLEDYVQGSGPVAEALLKQAGQPDFGLTGELDYMKDLLQAAETTDPVEKERQIDALRWNWLEEKTFFEPFDITALFAYVVRTEILERWALLDPEQGRERFTEIIEGLRGEARVPEEFVRPKAAK